MASWWIRMPSLGWDIIMTIIVCFWLIDEYSKPKCDDDHHHQKFVNKRAIGEWKSKKLTLFMNCPSKWLFWQPFDRRSSCFCRFHFPAKELDHQAKNSTLFKILKFSFPTILFDNPLTTFVPFIKLSTYQSSIIGCPHSSIEFSSFLTHKSESFWPQRYHKSTPIYISPGKLSPQYTATIYYSLFVFGTIVISVGAIEFL